MKKGERVVSYITRTKKVKDELVVVGDKIDDTDLVKIVVNDLSKHWEVFASVKDEKTFRIAIIYGMTSLRRS